MRGRWQMSGEGRRGRRRRRVLCQRNRIGKLTLLVSGELEIEGMSETAAQLITRVAICLRNVEHSRYY